jgi:hypothetical protein
MLAVLRDSVNSSWLRSRARFERLREFFIARGFCNFFCDDGRHGTPITLEDFDFSPSQKAPGTRETRNYPPNVGPFLNVWLEVTSRRKLKL